MLPQEEEEDEQEHKYAKQSLKQIISKIQTDKKTRHKTDVLKITVLPSWLISWCFVHCLFQGGLRWRERRDWRNLRLVSNSHVIVTGTRRLGNWWTGMTGAGDEAKRRGLRRLDEWKEELVHTGLHSAAFGPFVSYTPNWTATQAIILLYCFSGDIASFTHCWGDDLHGQGWRETDRRRRVTQSKVIRATILLWCYCH